MDEVYGERLLISTSADKSDLKGNILAVRAFELSKYIARRKIDFTTGMITDCYIVFAGEAVRVNARYQTRRGIERKIEMLKP